MLPHPASYRDNSGFVFEQNGKFYRYVHPGYEMHYSRLMKSGLYDELVRSEKLIAHEETAGQAAFGFTGGNVLLPQQLAFISYPYEWSFDMWKDAALLTLHIALAALKKDMVLKDATPFNVQFVNGKPLFIDTLSFENYESGKPWVAYHQFSECFLGPLLLMHYCHPDSGKLFTVYPSGIPMDVLVNLLPKSSRWNMNTFLHIHLQAKFSGKQQKRSGSESHFSRRKLELLLKGLEGFIGKLSPKKVKTAWDDYYTSTILGDAYLQAKTTLVRSFCNDIEYKTVIDLGANDGHFSLLFNEDKQVMATDADSNCINHLYLKIKKEGRGNILPLVNDLATPSPAIGWANTERDSFTARLKADLVLALALVHHLAIAGNVPLQKIAGWLQPMAGYLIIEFVPKTDEKVQLLLQNRKDIFNDYSAGDFKTAFAGAFQIIKEEEIGNTGRILFLMKRR
jgi:hypothetical protein